MGGEGGQQGQALGLGPALGAPKGPTPADRAWPRAGTQGPSLTCFISTFMWWVLPRQ